MDDVKNDVSKCFIRRFLFIFSFFSSTYINFFPIYNKCPRNFSNIGRSSKNLYTEKKVHIYKQIKNPIQIKENKKYYKN